MKDYLKTKKLSDDLGHLLLLEFNNSLIFGVDFLHDGIKYLIPEINPTTILYSNATRFYKKLIPSRIKLFENSLTLKEFNKQIDLKVFGELFNMHQIVLLIFRLRGNALLIEEFLKKILEECIDKNGAVFEPSITHKLCTLLPKVYGKRFRTRSKRDNLRVRKVIELRNEIIHLAPNFKRTNTKYKS